MKAKNIKQLFALFLSFLTTIPLINPPIINGGIDKRPSINEADPDANLY